ncbi:LSD1-like2 [Actinidia rufa]|uniref:LSD1-like2 n=1 Tax=Actinidia rufa TaxID=165716 RepID=A0A7J0GP15_9ERIC|nr:LSD1-like2 [Actinidia rufa]
MNYDENLMDELIDNHVGRTLKKKNRTKKDLEKETKTEAMLALSLGFPIDALIEEEIKAGVVSILGGKEQNDDIVATEGSVIIVGAGLAGLAAARQLLSFGFKVVVLEGRNRPGGRVYTQKMGRNSQFAAVDLGGSVITGIHANPLGVMARQLSIPLHKVRDNCPLYKPNGEPVGKEVDSKIELVFNKLLDKVTELRQIMGGFANDISLGSVLETLQQLYAAARTIEERQLLDWHFANLEYANAGCLSNLSAAYWDQDDPYEMGGGDHCFLPGGNWRLLKALSEGVPIFYGKTVHSIKYGNEGVEVVAGDQVFRADMVLCSVPLGVLKKRSIRFKPELPERKLAAIERLGFGLLNKVAMVFPYVFWGEDLDTFGCLMLIALVAGDAAQSFECTDPSTLLHHVLSILRESVGSRLFFAGEATNRQYPATMHGAFLSGLREASCIFRATRGRHSSNPWDCIPKHVVPSNDILVELFKKPDLVFGNFLFVFDSQTEDANSMGIMSITLGSSNSECSNGHSSKEERENSCHGSLNQTLQLYTMLSRGQAHELQLVTGGDQNRLSYLLKCLVLKLMGANAIGLFGSSLIANIATA